MIQVQFVITFTEGNNHIALNILEREDANDLEREMARHIQELHMSIFEGIRDDMPDGDVTIEQIGGLAPLGGTGEYDNDHHNPRHCP